MKRKRHPFSETLSSAKEILSKGDNRLTLIGAFLLLIASCLLYRLLYIAFMVVANLISYDFAWVVYLLVGAYFLLAAVFTLFVVLPLFYGVLLMAWAMVKGGNPSLAAIFDPFCDKKLYLRCLRLAWRAVSLFLVLTLAVLVSAFLIGMEPAKGLTPYAAVGLLLCCVVWSALRFPLFCFAMARVRMPLRDAKRRTRVFLRFYPLCGFRYLIRFLPHVLLGVLTLGIYLLAHVLPLMVLTYFRECETIHELLMIHLEENKDHE